MKYIVLLGRIFYSLIFLMGGANDFTKAAVAYTQAAGVPMASVLAPFAGLLAILGGLSVATGSGGPGICMGEGILACSLAEAASCAAVGLGRLV